MASKFIVFSCLVAMARAGAVVAGAVAAPLVAAPAPLVAAPVAARLEEFEHPQYSYGYQVSDHITGDYKEQSEQRDGDFVSGRYSLVEPDGASRRVVEYASDPVNGFQAVVRNEPLVVAAPAVVEPARIAAAPVAPARLAAAPVVAPAPARLTAAYPAPAARYFTAAPVASPFARLTAAYPYRFAPAASVVAV
ncbi:larval cuticle protein A2B-like [Plutella xylostella]|uniref:larval cuticle protein A2B-like n=1 Tax=Plutella xylostella TaxID=51655 RepID=UPI00203256BA|nr:larval cuticle protein A2B-like [Plutella xylostella]